MYAYHPSEFPFSGDIPGRSTIGTVTRYFTGLAPDDPNNVYSDPPSDRNRGVLRANSKTGPWIVQSSLSEFLAPNYFSPLTTTPWAYVNFDASLKEEHHEKVTTTSYPVEYGVSISDHAYREPTTLNLSVLVSNTPISPAAIAELKQSPTTTRHIEKYDALRRIMFDRELVSVLTGFRWYENMMIVNVSVPRDAGISRNSSIIDISLKEIITVSTDSVYVDSSLMADDVSNGASETSSEQVAEEVDEEHEESIFFSGGEMVFEELPATIRGWFGGD